METDESTLWTVILTATLNVRGSQKDA